MKFAYTLTLFLALLTGYCAQAQQKSYGAISGSVIDKENKVLQNASIQICAANNNCHTMLTDKDGFFEFDSLAQNYYSIKVSIVGFAVRQIDSINVRDGRMEFNLGEITLSNKINTEDEVVIYAEKPMIENKDGKIIFNVGETAAANASNVNELLQKTPLVTIDADGKILIKRKRSKNSNR